MTPSVVTISAIAIVLACIVLASANHIPGHQGNGPVGVVDSYFNKKVEDNDSHGTVDLVPPKEANEEKLSIIRNRRAPIPGHQGGHYYGGGGHHGGGHYGGYNGGGHHGGYNGGGHHGGRYRH